MIAETLSFGGLERNYHWHIPPSVPQPCPLLVSLHGRLGTGVDQQELTRFDLIADREGFICLFPDGIDKSWNSLDSPSNPLTVDDVGFLEALIDLAIAEHGCDPARVFMTGISNGAFMTNRFAAERADRLAGIGTVAGEIGTELSASFAPSRPVPACIIHGTADPYVPYTGGDTESGGSTLSVDETVARWRTVNGSTKTFTTKRINKLFSLDGSVDYFRWEGDAPVELFRINSGGHQWPGGKWIPTCGTLNNDIDASEQIWRFFRS